VITGASGICLSCCESCGRRAGGTEAGDPSGVGVGVVLRLAGVRRRAGTFERAVACSWAVFVNLRATEESCFNGVFGDSLSLSFGMGRGGASGVAEVAFAFGVGIDSVSGSSFSFSFNGVGGGGCDSTSDHACSTCLALSTSGSNSSKIAFCPSSTFGCLDSSSVDSELVDDRRADGDAQPSKDELWDNESDSKGLLGSVEATVAVAGAESVLISL
jgi:hypothetical protein